MKKFRVALSLVLLGILLITTLTSAQYTGFSWGTAYNVVNTGTTNSTIQIEYYNSSGVKQDAATRTYTGVKPGESRLVIQPKDDTSLASGVYSAVISSNDTITAIVNQELYPSGSLNPAPPFSSYSGESEGARSVFLPSILYNWYDYYTEFFVMNVDPAGGDATVNIYYTPGVSGSTTQGAKGVKEEGVKIKQYASITRSQKTMTSLGANIGGQPRFLGSALITSDKDIVVVVNEHNVTQYKLMTSNGFAGSYTKYAVPIVMRGYYGYYSAITVANASSTKKACVNLTYTPDTTKSKLTSGSAGSFTVKHVLSPNSSVLRYDGPGAADAQSDLDDSPVYSQFYGSMVAESVVDAANGCTTAAPIAVVINTEAVSTGDDQSGSFNGVPFDKSTNTLIAPVILADYYGYYTNMVVQNTTNTKATCTIKYTSAPGSSVSASKSYTHTLPANGSFTVYEGRKGGQEIGDINHDTAWRNAKGEKLFIGAATVTCVSSASASVKVPVVGFVNEEKDVLNRDSMYSFNMVNK